ncbi:MAG: ABC transporter ATP-binding protein [Hyphomicrobiaceae bacterium]
MTAATASPAPATATAEKPPIVEVRSVSKVYAGGVEALSAVSLDFREGQLTALLGPSGCGKTTLLKIVAGLIPGTSGEVRIKGRSVTGPGPERSFVFQDFALLPWATVLRNAAFGLELRGMPRARREAAAQAQIAKVGLAGFEHRYPHELSGGMRQRVGLARALAVDAEIILMDEPFSAVDEQTRRKFQEDLLELIAQERRTFIFVTHSIEEAVYVADRIALLTARPGRISQVIDVAVPRGTDRDAIRRHPVYLDTVESIWSGLKQYVE